MDNKVKKRIKKIHSQLIKNKSEINKLIFPKNENGTIINCPLLKK